VQQHGDLQGLRLRPDKGGRRQKSSAGGGVGENPAAAKLAAEFAVVGRHQYSSPGCPPFKPAEAWLPANLDSDLFLNNALTPDLDYRVDLTSSQAIRLEIS
jgi:hypothetical protein